MMIKERWSPQWSIVGCGEGDNEWSETQHDVSKTSMTTRVGEGQRERGCK